MKKILVLEYPLGHTTTEDGYTIPNNELASRILSNPPERLGLPSGWRLTEVEYSEEERDEGPKNLVHIVPGPAALRVVKSSIAAD